jgi:Na+-transporting methylmalonyl-CoA/oxaloacetate decarboxylase gamma subunit
LTSFEKGLEVSLLGILITFLALGVFILIMIVLQRLFPAKETDASAKEDEQPLVEVKIEEIGEDAAVVAAIAAALSYLRARAQSSLGSSLQEGRGSWWSSRKMEARLGKHEKR